MKKNMSNKKKQKKAKTKTKQNKQTRFKTSKLAPSQPCLWSAIYRDKLYEFTTIIFNV